MLNRLAFAFLLVSLAACTKKNQVPENSVTYGLTAQLKGLDPARASDEASNEVGGNIYEGLLQYNYLKRPLVVEPLLAAAMPEISKDGLTYTFKLKPGVRFQDSEIFPGGKGREITAQDFIYSWRRVADPKTKSEGFWIFDGKIKGLNEWREKLGKGEATYETPIEGFQAPDNNTLIIKLTRPYFQLEYVLTMVFSAVMPKEGVEKYGDEYLNHPVGTGPYAIQSWNRGHQIILKRNPNWHGGTYPSEGAPGDLEKGLLSDAGKALPFVDAAVFMELPEDQPRWLNLMSGTLDFSSVPKDNVDTVFDEARNLRPEITAKGMKLTVWPRADLVYFAFNMTDPLLGENLNLRKALSLAYDYATSEKKFYNDLVISAHSPIVPDVEGWDPGFKNPYHQFDLEKAKDYLKKAGFPGGKGLPVLEFSYPTTSTGDQMAEFVKLQFEQIGVKVNLVTFPWPQFSDRIRNKKSQIYTIAWNADYPDAENHLQLLYSKNVSPGPNGANYKNKEFDALYEAAQKLPPSPARTALYYKMRDIYVRDLPWMTSVHRKGYTVYQGWVNNLKRNLSIKNWAKYVRIDTAKKKELKAKL